MNTNKKRLLRKSLLILSIFLFVGCSAFLIYYLGIQPYHSRQINNKYRNIYYASGDASEVSTEGTSATGENIPETTLSFELDNSYKNNEKNKDGILLKFSKLLQYNSDIKGWLNISGTGIDYPVMQDYNGGDFYLKHDFEGNSDKNGCLYLDGNCSIKPLSKNIVIHGHNMESTKMMFYELPQYKDINFYKDHPVITFDTIYKNSQWKVIAFMRVSGNTTSSGSFNYMQSDFEDDETFLDFLYQIELRSLYKCPVDVNENDSLLMLSTCSYEVNNYRSVVVARKLRKGESEEVDTDAAYMRSNVLYPSSWYGKYGGAAPVVTNFKDALSFNEIDWYDGDIQVDASVGKVITYDNSQYQITSSTTLKYLCCNNVNVKTLTIPSTIKLDGRTYDVTEISKNAFDYAPKLKNLKIGNKVSGIESKTFINCTGLESVIIGDSVEYIGSKAFYKLEKLSKIKIRSTHLTAIEEKAFSGIALKAKFKLPKSKSKSYSKLLKNSGVPEKIKIKEY